MKDHTGRSVSSIRMHQDFRTCTRMHGWMGTEYSVIMTIGQRLRFYFARLMVPGRRGRRVHQKGTSFSSLSMNEPTASFNRAFLWTGTCPDGKLNFQIERLPYTWITRSVTCCSQVKNSKIGDIIQVPFRTTSAFYVYILCIYG